MDNIKSETGYSPSQIHAILKWHLDCGVDETISESAVNRFDVIQAPAPQAEKQPGPDEASQIPSKSTPPPQRPLPNEEILKSAFEQAEAATTVEELRQTLENFEGCSLKNTADKLVFMEGPSDAKILLVGDVPGATEDRQGRPFSGPGGMLLDKMLASIEQTREQVAVCHSLFWRPPGGRTPTQQEIVICAPFIERLIELIDPDILVVIGGIAAKSLLAENKTIARLRGSWFTYSTPRLSHPIDAIPVFSPEYLRQTPAHKRAAWQDLVTIKHKLAPSIIKN